MHKLNPMKKLSLLLFALLLLATACKKEKINDKAEVPTIPVSAINGLFTINENGDQVYFSKGNLQYQASTNTWRFAENQWDYIGNDNSNVSTTYDGWIDLFGWGTGWNPTLISTNNWDYDIFYDWGYNPIINGSNKPNTWRTLTLNEWKYIFYTRNTNSNIRYARATVNDIKGLILLPDNWNESIYMLNDVNTYASDFDSNIISLTEWLNTFEANGVIFLSNAGRREADSVNYVGSQAHYWSSTPHRDPSMAYYVFVYNTGLHADMNYYRYYGRCVRLVQDVDN